MANIVKLGNKLCHFDIVLMKLQLDYLIKLTYNLLLRQIRKMFS